ncbi:unnamed protein product [Adineta ricciae]|uniref:G-protein coupled receptors family 1 profile domain-containing protein n=1 Tax=Adineta ricciae TaxID=249248 RepID=A0A815H8L8_ADIRI|nr:unnamed protein product [Adineta ricciae]CAF1348872.1 unnamed protein product [Adineta ricciae]
MLNITDTSRLSSTLVNIQGYMTLYGMPLVLFFGASGNMINCGVFLQKNLRSNSCSIYFIASSISHTILLIWAMSTNMYSVTNKDPLAYSTIYCKIRPYLISSLFMISRTYIVLACADRYALCSPDVRIRAFSRSQNAFRLIPLVILIWIFLPIHIAIFNTIEGNQCIMPGIYRILYAVYAIICAGILPPFSMVTFGLLAYRNLRYMRRRIQPANSDQRRQTRIKRTDFQIMKMLSVEVMIYCASTLPFPINTVYAAATVNVIKSKDRAAVDAFLSFLAGSILQYMNASTAMYSNLITSAAFRNELKKFFKNCLKLHRVLSNAASTREHRIVPADGTPLND